MNKGLQTAFAFVAVLITMGFLWMGNRPVIPITATWQDVVQEAQNGGYHLIKIEELAKHYQQTSPEMRLIDTRQEWEYRAGSIKGALNFPQEPTAWSRWRNRGRLKEFLGPDKSKFTVFF